MIVTHIAYKKRMNVTLLNEILNELKNKGLIDTTPKKRTYQGNPKEGYVITFKGIQLRRDIEKILLSL